MNDNKTRSMLQRIPMILAVTAASYGLPLQGHATPARTPTSHSVSRASTAVAASAQARLAPRH
jgi:hypothetical protein